MNCIKVFKLLILALCVVLILSFSACGKTSNDEYAASENDTVVSDTEGDSTTHEINLEEDIFEKPDSEDSGGGTTSTPSVEANGNASKDSNSKDSSSKDTDSKNDSSKNSSSTNADSKNEESENSSSKNNVGEITEDGKIKLPTVWFD